MIPLRRVHNPVQQHQLHGGSKARRGGLAVRTIPAWSMDLLSAPRQDAIRQRFSGVESGVRLCFSEQGIRIGIHGQASVRRVVELPPAPSLMSPTLPLTRFHSAAVLLAYHGSRYLLRVEGILGATDGTSRRKTTLNPNFGPCSVDHS